MKRKIAFILSLSLTLWVSLPIVTKAIDIMPMQQEWNAISIVNKEKTYVQNRAGTLEARSNLEIYADSKTLLKGTPIIAMN